MFFHWKFATPDTKQGAICYDSSSSVEISVNGYYRSISIQLYVAYIGNNTV